MSVPENLDLSKLVLHPDIIKQISDQVYEKQTTERKRKRPLPSDEPDDTICDDELKKDVTTIASEVVASAVVSFDEKINQVLAAINNTNTSLKSLDQRLVNNTNKLENLSHEINDLRQHNKKELTEIKNQVRTQAEDLRQAKNQIAGLSEEILSLQNDRLETKRALIDQSARSRRNNLIFYGIEKEENKKCEDLVLNFIKNKLKMENIKSSDIQRAHPLRKSEPGKPAPIITYFHEYKVKEDVRAKRFGLERPFGMAQDLPPEICAARRALNPKLEAAKKANKKAWIIYPCRLVIDNVITESIDVAKFSVQTR